MRGGGGSGTRLEKWLKGNRKEGRWFGWFAGGGGGGEGCKNKI